MSEQTIATGYTCGSCGMFVPYGTQHWCASQTGLQYGFQPTVQSFDISSLLNELVSLKLRMARVEEVFKLFPQEPPKGPDGSIDGEALWKTLEAAYKRAQELGL